MVCVGFSKRLHATRTKTLAIETYITGSQAVHVSLSVHKKSKSEGLMTKTRTMAAIATRKRLDQSMLLLHFFQ